MKRGTKRALVVGGALVVLGAAGAGTAIATSDDDAGDRPIEGPALEKASEAALEETGGGTVTETEVGDEESYYEVEVTREDGSQVDVQLDRDFQVVSSEGDSETEDE